MPVQRLGKTVKPSKGKKFKIPTMFEHMPLIEVIQSTLYTSDEMFGEIQWAAQVELFRRIPVPDWAKKHELPLVARQALEEVDK